MPMESAVPADPVTCPGGSVVVFDPSMTGYDFGPTHPMAPVRVDLTMRLATDLGVTGPGGVLREVPAPIATEDELATVHSGALLEAVMTAGRDPRRADYSFGLGSEDNPVFVGMHDAGAHVVGATVEAMRQVWTGRATHAANVAGGLHHAMPGRVSGFCIYNDIAVGIKWLLDNGAERVAYVDVDVHHGDGVQSIFYNDPRVLTVSLHETPIHLFPGTGFPHESGGPQAQGSAINVALPSGTDDRGWLRAFDAVVPEAVAAFKPTIVVSQHGCDSHKHDPLADLHLSVDGQRASYLAIEQLAEQHTQGRWIAAGGGGYALLDVVPRAWAHLLAIIAGRPVPPETEIPQQWRARNDDRMPNRMTDGCPVDFPPLSDGFDPASRLDQAILATRRAVFPELGLDPEP